MAAHNRAPGLLIFRVTHNLCWLLLLILNYIEKIYLPENGDVAILFKSWQKIAFKKPMDSFSESAVKLRRQATVSP